MPLPALPPGADIRSITERVNALIRQYNRTDVSIPLYAVDTGSATAYAIAPVPGIESYAVGQTFIFKATNANTGTAPTLAVNGLTAGTITRVDGSALAAGEIPANGLVEVIVAATTPVFHLVTKPAVGAGATTFLTTTSPVISTGTSVVNTGSIGDNGWKVLVIGVLVGLKTDGQAFVGAEIYDGTAVRATAEAVNPAANQSVTVTVAYVASLTAPTTFTLRGTSSATNTYAMRASSGGGTTDKMTAITWVRIA